MQKLKELSLINKPYNKLLKDIFKLKGALISNNCESINLTGKDKYIEEVED